jgi:hypothetical protein
VLRVEGVDDLDAFGEQRRKPGVDLLLRDDAAGMLSLTSS